MQLRIVILFLLCLGIGCAHKIEIVQGSILKPEDISQLKIGMNKVQVEYILGTPSIINALNRDRWDYIYRTRKGKKIREKKGYLLFNNERLQLIVMGEFLRE